MQLSVLSVFFYYFTHKIFRDKIGVCVRACTCVCVCVCKRRYKCFI